MVVHDREERASFYHELGKGLKDCSPSLKSVFLPGGEGIYDYHDKQKLACWLALEGE